ncbi:MAG: NAD(P)/FAD-dependent oxidoreductase [archaeon]
MANEESFDVIVVGAGPAGGECARHLSENSKLSVLLIDETTELGQPKKSTAGALDETVLEFGLPKRTSLWEIDSLVFKGRTNTSKLPCKGHVLDFAYLKSFLAREAMRSGAHFLLGAVAEGPIIEGGKVVGIEYRNIYGEKQIAKSRLVIDATGPSAVIATKAGIRHLDTANHGVGVEFEMDGFDVEYPRSWVIGFDFERVPGGYYWVYPLGETSGRVGVCWRMDAFMKKRPAGGTPLHQLKLLIESDERFRKGTPVEMHGGAGYLDTSERAVGDGLIAAGDAVSTLEPIVGEGIREALRSGRLAAKVSLDAFSKNDFSGKFLSRYCSELERMQKDRKFRMLLSKAIYNLPNDRIDKVVENLGKLDEGERERLFGFGLTLKDALKVAPI